MAISNAEKLKKFFKEELGIDNIEDFEVFNRNLVGSSGACIGFKCPEELKYLKNKCEKCKYKEFWNKASNSDLENIVGLFNTLRKKSPNTVIYMETDNGFLSCRLKDTSIYTSADGKLMIES